MVRSAAKNYEHVAVVTDPADYAAHARGAGAARAAAIGADTRFRLAQKAFSHTAAYDGAISNYLTALDAAGERAALSRSGSTCNSSSRSRCATGRTRTRQAAFYRDPQPAPGSLAGYRQLQGKELSYNNIADADAAWECVKSFAQPACVIVKHANPCGAAVGDDAGGGLPQGVRHRSHLRVRRHHRVQPRARHGRRAQAVTQQFVEVVIAPRHRRRGGRAAGGQGQYPRA